jgi:hypothetical protein
MQGYCDVANEVRRRDRTRDRARSTGSIDRASRDREEIRS